MAYTLDIQLNLGLGKTGLADLRAQLYDIAGANVGSAVSTGFFELGSGLYNWHYAAWPDGHRGGVYFYSNATPALKLAGASINEQEVENPDVKTSTRLASGSYTAPDNATITAIAAALTTVGTNVTTLLARLGAFAGTGVNTVLGFLRAMSRMDLAAPSDMGGTYDPATDSLEALSTGGGGLTAAAVWSYITRTLTQSAAQVTAAVSGTTIVCKRGDSLSASLTGLGSLTGRTKLWFTVKANLADADTASIIQITELGGLIYLIGAAAVTPGQGSLTVTDAALGNITIALDEAATALLVPGARYTYDVQVLNGGNVTTLTEATFQVPADVTRAIV